MSLQNAKRASREANDILNDARREGREPTASERRVVERLLNEAKAELGDRHDIPHIDGMSNVSTDPRAMFTPMDPGQAFVRSDGYRQIKSSAGRGQSWSSGPVEVGLQTKGTTFEGIGGTLVPPDYRSGIVSQLFTPVGFADFLPQQQTPSVQVRYVVEGTATNAAAGVAEMGVKPEATLAYNEVVEQVRKIAVTVPSSDELLEDSVGISQYISGRLMLFVALEEERQIFRGAGGGSNELLGIFGRSISTTNAGTSNADRIFRAAAGVRGSAFVDPNIVVLHPSNWVTSRLQQDAAGQYYGAGPWGTNYGQSGAASTSGFSSSPFWGMQVWVSPHVGVGTALLGATSSATLYRRGARTVEATNAHSDWFVKDMSMLRRESRAALAVFRPSAWCAVTGLT